MESSRTQSLLDQLDDEIDELEEALEPLLQGTLFGTAAKLPLLDQAKLHILATYSMESLIFFEAYLRLNGIEAKEHPVFEELARVKQYFAKIKNIENPDAGKRGLVVDKEAAARMIKHGVTGNDKIDQERAARQNIQFSGTHIKLDESSNKRSADDMSTGEPSASTPKKTKKVKGDKPKKEKSKLGQRKGG